MPNTSPLNVQYLDFDTIKANLQAYLQAQSQFKDYDFEGSGLSVLLDILAYNTHYFGFYMNMCANEMFLDSANMRSSVVSIAKNLDYTPRSITSAQAVVGIVLTPNDGASSAVINKNTPFATSINGTTFSFVTKQAYGTTLSASGTFIFSDVLLIEGVPYSFQFIVDPTIPNQQFILPPNVDTSTLTVVVQTSVTNTTTITFTLAAKFLEIQSTTPVYFLDEGQNGQFQITFGDGVIGQALSPGNVIVASYLISSGLSANGASIFTPSVPLSGYPANNSLITTLASAAGGLAPESTEEIRFAAPKNYQMQSRAVTADDYIGYLTENYTNADSIVVWGGEDNDPPQYGKVFISIKPVTGFVLTDTTKTLIVQDIVRKANIVSVIPEFVDPDYTFIIVNCTVKYDPTVTFQTLGDIESEAYDAIINYAAINLDKFDLQLRYSKLLTAIDASDPSITSNLTLLQMKKIFAPTLSISTNYDLYFYNAVLPGSLSSSSFVNTNDPLMLVPYVNGYTYILKDDGAGNVQMWDQGIGIPGQSVRKCGTIDYSTGHVQLTQFMPFQADVNGNISVIMTPQENDITPIQNNILFVQGSDVQVTVIPVTS